MIVYQRKYFYTNLYNQPIKIKEIYDKETKNFILEYGLVKTDKNQKNI